jgi:hypothetical protein
VRLHRALLVVVGGLALFAVLPEAHSQDASTVDQTGWWSRRPGAAEIADGGFEVAWTLDEQSVAAVRISVGAEAGEDPTFLVLSESGGFGQDTSGIQVCPITGAWRPANPGAYEDRPTGSCEQAISAGRDSASARWTIDITSAVSAAQGGTLSYLLVPTPTPVDSNVPLNAPFQLVFSGAQVLVQQDAAPTTTTTFFDDSGGFTDPGFADPGVGGGVPLPDVQTNTTIPELPTSTTAVVDDPGELAAPGPAEAAGSDDDPPWGRLILLVPLSAAAGYGATYARRWLRERGLSAGGAPA